MGLQSWDTDDDQDVQSYRRRTRFERTLAFLDEAVDELEADKTKSEKEDYISEP